MDLPISLFMGLWEVFFEHVFFSVKKVATAALLLVCTHVTNSNVFQQKTKENGHKQSRRFFFFFFFGGGGGGHKHGDCDVK